MSDRDADGPETADDRCTHCEEPIETDEWHPVRTVEREGALIVYTFCSNACREAWEP